MSGAGGEGNAGSPPSEGGGLLLYGEGIANLSERQAAAVWEFARSLTGSLAVRAVSIPDVAEPDKRHELEPAPEGEFVFDLTSLSPDEAVRLDQEVDRVSRETPDVADYLGEAISEGLRRLPYADPEHGARVFSALAESDEPWTRRTATIFIAHLFRANPDAAVPIWERLLADDDAMVAEEAGVTFDGRRGELLAQGKMTAPQLLRLSSAQLAGKEKHTSVTPLAAWRRRGRST